VWRDHEKISAMSARAEQKVFVLLALQAPVAGDLPAIVSSVQSVADVERMGALATHVAEIVRRRHPQHALPEGIGDRVHRLGGSWREHPAIRWAVLQLPFGVATRLWYQAG
jgi:phosphate transport system protein